MTRVFIIIVNFNGKKYILDCLETVKDEEVEIIVVDNGSTDGSLQLIKSLKFSNLKIIQNKRNLGFAKGCNVGIRYALQHNAVVVLLLNPDTLVSKRFLKPLLTNKADIVAPVIKFKRKGQWIYDFGGRVNWWLGRTIHIESIHLGGGRLRDHRPRRLYFTSEEVDFATTVRGGYCHRQRWKKIDYVSGCCMLIKRSVFEKIGLFDERYFLYFEDVDFCLRAKKAEFEVAVEPKSVILHKLSEKRKKSLSQHFNHLKSNFIFINSWIPWWRRPLAYGYLVVLLFKVAVSHLGGGRLRDHGPRCSKIK